MIRIEVIEIDLGKDILVIHSDHNIDILFQNLEWFETFKSLGINHIDINRILELCTFSYNRILIKGKDIEFVKSLIPEYFI